MSNKHAGLRGAPHMSIDDYMRSYSTNKLEDLVWVVTNIRDAHRLVGRAVVSTSSIRGDLWVIRVSYNGDLTPGKLFIKEKMATITYAGHAINMHDGIIEVLCAQPNTYKWVESSNGNVPIGAIPGGVTANGELLYIGRAKNLLLKFLAPGKVHPSHRCCYVVFSNLERAVQNYYVLTKC